MATFKCTMLFSYQSNLSGGSTNFRSGGWTESVYFMGDSITFMKAAFRNLCLFRAALLSNAATIVGQRYQRIDPLGQSVSEAQRFGGSSLLADIPQMAVTFTVPGLGVPNSRRFTLRGVSDARVVEGEFLPSNNFTSALRQFVSELSNFRFRARNQVTTRVPISSISQVGVFVLQQPLTFAVDDYLNVSEAVGQFQGTANGRFHVVAKVDSKNGTFSNWKYPATTGGFAKLDELIYPQLDGTAEVFPVVVVRKVGRPFGGYRGRASVRR